MVHFEVEVHSPTIQSNFFISAGAPSSGVCPKQNADTMDAAAINMIFFIDCSFGAHTPRL
jgi:hypothetical protein